MVAVVTLELRCAWEAGLGPVQVSLRILGKRVNGRVGSVKSPVDQGGNFDCEKSVDG